MPFSMAMVSGGGRFYSLVIPVDDLAIAFDVEAEVFAAYGVTTRPFDRIRVTVNASRLVADLSTSLTIDGDGLDDQATLEIALSGGEIDGRGGDGGNGGAGIYDAEPPGRDLSRVGQPGDAGGTAIRCGCPTTVTGTGTLSKGYGGGGGGGGAATGLSVEEGGGGGGGGAPLGAFGSGGLSGLSGGGSDSGQDGTVATTVLKGLGGAGGGTLAGDGGDGGDSTSVAQAGDAGTKVGGAAGADGNAVDTQGFAFVVDPGIVVVGAII